MAKSKFFRVAVEGATATDGRTIERSWIEDIAGGYNRDTYGARVNMEHVRGYSPEAPFNAYGDVLSVKAEEVTIKLNGKDEKRLALLAEIEPTDALVKLTQAKQKIYTSIEVAPNFANTNKAGLVGLAVTDSPASLATEVLAFSAKPEAASVKALFDARKQDPANVFSAAEETSIEMAEDAPAAESALDKFARIVVEKLTGKEPEKKPEPTPASKTDGAVDLASLGTMFKELTTALSADRKADRDAADAKFAELSSTIAGLKADVENTPERNHSSRPKATGGADRQLADF